MWMLWMLACSPQMSEPEAEAPVQEPLPAPVPVAGAPEQQGGPAGEAVERTWTAELAEVDHRADYFRARLKEDPGDRLALDQLVSLLLDRAQLTGDYDDYARAQELVDGAFASADARAQGPHGSAFAVAMALHRFDAAEEHLTFVRRSAPLRAQLEFARGDYASARTFFEKTAKSGRPEHLARLAILEWKTGHMDKADQLLQDAARGYHGRFHRPEAWYELHRGILDLERDQLHDAMTHYLQARKRLDGYWLIDEHIAEIHLLQGNLDEARRMYEDLVERTGNPEFMDRLAETLEQQGHTDEAEAMVAKARAVYEQRLERFPEATWGHAIDHWLSWGDPAETLAMARKNAANRPNGEAKLALVQALIKAGEVGEARSVLAQVQASPFDVPEVAAIAEELASK